VIVTDSSACLPADVIAQYGIRVVPLALVIGGETVPDGALSAEELFALIDGADGPPKSAAPAPGEFAAGFRAELEAGAEEILCLTLSAAYSGTYEAAVAGAAMIGPQVRVVDTDGLAMTHGFAVLAGARSLVAGGSLDDAAALAKAVGAGGGLVGALDTLRYLVKGGRVPRVVGWAAAALSIKQMLAFEGGSAQPIGRARTMAKACERLVDYAARKHTNGRGMRVAVMHTGAPEMAERLAEAARERLSPVEMMITELTSVMAAHTGPGFVGLAVSDD